MSPAIIVFIATVFTTAIVWELVFYAQFYSYAQWQWMDSANFLLTHGRYVARAGVTTYAPIMLNFLAVGLLLFFRPTAVSLGPVVALNAINLLGTLITFTLPVPIHIRIDREQRYTPHDLELLLRYNMLRVVLSTVNAAIVLYLLGTTLAAGA